jgi:hypothetical protein
MKMTDVEFFSNLSNNLGAVTRSQTDGEKRTLHKVFFLYIIKKA